MAHTLIEHGERNGLPNVMIEIRNDLLAAEQDRVIVSDLLAKWLTAACEHLSRITRLCRGRGFRWPGRQDPCPGVIRLYVKTVDSVNRRLGRLVMYLIFVMVGILLWSSISKTFFLPSLWTLEMAQFAMVSYYMLGGPYAIQLGLQRADGSLLRRLVGPQEGLVRCLHGLPADLLPWRPALRRLGEHLLFLQYNERSSTAWRPILWPIKITMCLSIFLMILQALSEFFKDVARIRGAEI